jgi:hypothetical protein
LNGKLSEAKCFSSLSNYHFECNVAGFFFFEGVGVGVGVGQLILALREIYLKTILWVRCFFSGIQKK